MSNIKCLHDLAEKETACADGCCPICLAKELDKCRLLLKASACPNQSCVDGGIPHHFVNSGEEVECDIEQCQFCYERSLLLSTPEQESHETT